MKQGKLMIEVFKQQLNRGIPETTLENLDEIYVHQNVENMSVKCTTVPDMKIDVRFDVDVFDRDNKPIVKRGIQIKIKMRNKKYDTSKPTGKDNKEFFTIGFGGLKYDPNSFANATLWDGRVVRVSYIPD